MENILKENSFSGKEKNFDSYNMKLGDLLYSLNKNQFQEIGGGASGKVYDIGGNDY